jgi:oligopeptide transport system substrate-binding protein
MAKQNTARSKWLGLGVCLIGLMLALACGGQEQPSSTSVEMAPPEQQVLRLRLIGEPKTIDPHLSNFTTESTVARQLFAGLFTYDEDLKIVPNLAAEVPTVENGGISRDGLTYTIKLDKDAMWSDGKPVTANDLVYSLRRALDPKLASPNVSFLYSIAGAREYNTALSAAGDVPPTDAQLASLRDKVGVSAKDANTVVYQLRQANPSFLNQLVLSTTFPVRQDVVERYGDRWTEAGNLIGNGAFVLTEWAHNERIVFEPNPYWAGQKPSLTQVVINFIADDAAAYAAYLAGEIDVVTVPAANLREVSTPGSPLNSELVGVPDLSTHAIFMNQAQAPFDNIKLRQAFQMAVDREAYVTGVLQGAGEPTTSWLPPALPGANTSLGREYEFNPAKAKQLLSEAGFPNGEGLPPITFMATATDANRIVGQFLEDQFKKNLGIDVTTEYIDSRTRSARFTASQFQVTVQSWSADWPYPDNWLPDLFGSTGQNNKIAFRSAAFDEAIAKAAAETDDDKRLALYNEAHRIMLSDAAISPLYNRETFILVKPQVKNLIFTAVDGALKGDYHLHDTFIAAN